MTRILARAATIAAAGLLATVAVAGAAQAEPITVDVPGCWGVGDTVLCDLAVTVTTPTVAPKTTYVPVCAGTCQNVPVTIVQANLKPTDVCYSYTNATGTPQGDCVLPIMTSGNVLDAVAEVVRDLFCCHDA